MSLVQVVAHRGSSARHADNTWAAFEAAVVEGADAIECDVQATRDGVLVVRHDLAIDDRLVADMRVAEIEARAPETVALAALLEFAGACADRPADRDEGSRRGRFAGAPRDGPARGATGSSSAASWTRARNGEGERSRRANVVHDGQRRGNGRTDSPRRRVSSRWRSPVLGDTRCAAAQVAEPRRDRPSAWRRARDHAMARRARRRAVRNGRARARRDLHEHARGSASHRGCASPELRGIERVATAPRSMRRNP